MRPLKDINSAPTALPLRHCAPTSQTAPCSGPLRQRRRRQRGACAGGPWARSWAGGPWACPWPTPRRGAGAPPTRPSGAPRTCPRRRRQGGGGARAGIGVSGQAHARAGGGSSQPPQAHGWKTHLARVSLMLGPSDPPPSLATRSSSSRPTYLPTGPA